MKTKSIISAVAIVLLFLTACKRTETTPGANILQNFFAGTRVTSQAFSINATNYNTITGAKSTIIRIPGGSLINKNGVTVTGTVNIELKEIYSKGDMILSNATTTCNGGMLQTGGEIYLIARQNGEDLRVKPGYKISVEFPTTNPVAGMQLFTGQFVQNSNLAADSSLVWTPVDSANAVVVQDSAFLGGFMFYDFQVDSFGWTNCDRFYNLTGGTDPMIQVPTQFDNSNTSVYMIFDAENSVADGDVYADHVFRFHSGNHTPIGLAVTIVVIAKIGTQYYYSINHETTAAGATFNVTPVAATHDAIVAAVSAL